MKTKNIVKEKSFKFSLQIISLYKKLIEEKEYIISKQLLRSATSIGANIEEADAGYSKKDFTAKMSIASKEARETEYWLRLLKFSKLTHLNVDNYLKDIDELIRLLTAIVKTAQNQ
ncbi:MAG TPA: four helix bundle protein [Balneolaceae bacterium]|nr:four helix bundle protein [Balneolaceae bacterium]